VYRVHNWRCWSCRWWQTHYPAGECGSCGRDTVVGHSGACRLCWEQARLLQVPGRAVDLAAANRFGQQLFLANMAIKRRGEPRPRPEPRPLPFTPLGWQQLVLFVTEPDPVVLQRRAAVADSGLLRHCDGVLREHATRHGWSVKHTNDVTRSLRLLQTLQDTSGAKINASDVLQLPRVGGTAHSTLRILALAGLLIDDRTPRVERYFAQHTTDLPAKMRAQLQTWLQVMLHGSRQPPRRRPRDPATVHLHLLGMAPILRTWAAHGHHSLAEISADQVLAALPAGGAHRNFAEQGLRSLFQVLTARKLVFADPTRGMRLTPVNATIPLPLDTQAIREALNSPDPACALAVALVAFHALTNQQLRALSLTDITDRRLTLDGRTIPLAGPVLPRLAAYLEHRARTWPATTNPHLFINRRSAPHNSQVSRQHLMNTAKLTPQALREDRILQEIHATGGDVRRICDLFGLTISTAMRYRAALEHPDLTHARPAPVSSETHHPA
jgi:site-specific recombinase XerD